jgi:hypothetical protein
MPHQLNIINPSFVLNDNSNNSNGLIGPYNSIHQGHIYYSNSINHHHNNNNNISLLNTNLHHFNENLQKSPNNINKTNANVHVNFNLSPNNNLLSNGNLQQPLQPPSISISSPNSKIMNSNYLD